MGNSDLSPSFRARIEELRRTYVGGVYDVIIDSERGKRGDPAFRGVGSNYKLCGFIECYERDIPAGERVRVVIDEINPSKRNGTACVVAFARIVY